MVTVLFLSDSATPAQQQPTDTNSTHLSEPGLLWPSNSQLALAERDRGLDTAQISSATTENTPWHAGRGV